MADEKSLFSVYRMVFQYIEEGFAVVYGVERDKKKVIDKMTKLNSAINEKLSNGSLTIADRNSLYLDTWIKVSNWSNNLAKRILRGKRQSEFRGKIVFVNPQILLHEGNYDELLALEKFIGKQFRIPIKIICCYDLKALLRLKPSILTKILGTHSKTIDRKSGYHALKREIVIDELLERALVMVFGEDTSSIVYKTLKLVYGIDRDRIAFELDSVEQKLERFIGKGNISRVYSATNSSLITNMIY